MGKPLRVLIVKDSEVDALLLILELKHGGYEPIHERVETAEAVHTALREKSWDIMLCDYTLPTFSALQALALFKETGIDIPFIIVSGIIGEEAVVEAMKAGAHDCIVKDRRKSLIPAIERELREAAIRREHKSVGAALRDSEGKFHLLIESAPDAIFVTVGASGCFAYLNSAAVRLFGAGSAEDLLGHSVIERLPLEYHDIVRQRIRLTSEEKKAARLMEQKYVKMDGSVIDVEVSAVPFTFENRNGALVFVRDITERRRAEEEQYRNRQTAERLPGEMAVIAEIGRVIGSTLNIEEVYERFAAETRKLIPFDSLAINLLNLQEKNMRTAYVSGSAIVGRRQGDSMALAGTLSEAVIHTRTGLLIQTETLDEIVSRFPGLSPIYQAGVRSLIGVPLISRDEVIGALHFRAEKPNAYTEQDLRLAERIGTQVAGAIANAQLFADLKKTESSLRESEARFRAIFEQAAVGVAEIDIATSRFITVNHRLCEMVGMTEEEMLASTFQAITYPDDFHLHEDKTALLMAGKIRHYDLEKRYIRKDGAIIWVNLTTSPLWKLGEAPTRNLIVVQDITERMRIQEENERRSKQLAALRETSLELMADLNLNTLLHSVVQRAMTLIGGDHCNCFLYKPELNLIERVADAGLSLNLGNTARQYGDGFVGQVWATGGPLLVNDYHSWQGRKREYDCLPPRALMGVPIRWGEEFLGVLNMVALLPHEFTQVDLEVLNLFATQAAIAIRNARLYDQIEQAAVTDELTGLFNRRGFFQLGEREFERALRLCHPLAAVMFDIDHFKRINDAYGHIAGDQVLSALADCFRQNTRGIDIAGRYGGEEFTLLLPETLLPGAIQIAERLRQSIEELAIPISSACGNSPADPVHITISLGVALMMPDIQSLSILIDRADQAQYRAKNSGRNQVAVWETIESLKS